MIFCFVFSRDGKMQDASEERMQNANRRDEHIFGSEDVQWRGKCRRVGSQVYSVLCFGSKNWCWSHAVVETKLLRRLFKVKKMEGCDSARVSHENSQNGKINVEKDEVALLE